MVVPIINQPQAGILSTDGVKRRPVVVVLPDGSESIAIHSVGNLTLSWDHRAFDGAYGSRPSWRGSRRSSRPGTGPPSCDRGAVSVFRARWLGRVACIREALDLQRALFERSRDDYLLLLEHPHTYTLGVRADRAKRARRSCVGGS